MKCFGLFFLLLSCLTACSREPTRPERLHLPYTAWYVGLAAPRHMEVWVESVDVLDQRGTAYFNIFGGVPGYTRKPEGWHNGGGASIPLSHIDLPNELVLRWQSLVESKTYELNIEIPQWVRDEMVKPERVKCVFDKSETTYYRNRINMGMAPGGIVKVWLGAGCLGYKEIGRYQAEVDPRGPYGGKSNGKYVPIEPENKAYVEKHGIPYGTW